MHVRYDTAGSFSWAAPDGVTEAWATLIGGGGGGGGGYPLGGGGGGGGAARVVERCRLYFSAGAILTCVVAPGGAGGAISGAGGIGGQSYISGLELAVPRAHGGQAGTPGTATLGGGCEKGPVTYAPGPVSPDGPQLPGGPAYEHTPPGASPYSPDGNGSWEGSHFPPAPPLFSGSGGGQGADPIGQCSHRGRTFIGPTNVDGGSGIGGGGGGCTLHSDGGRGGDEGFAGLPGTTGSGGGGGGQNAPGGDGGAGLILIEWDPIGPTILRPYGSGAYGTGAYG